MSSTMMASTSESAQSFAIGAAGMDFNRAVINALARMTANQNQIDQTLLRYWLALSPSWLLLDSTSGEQGRPAEGIIVWQRGLLALVNVMLVLHAKGQLEWETVNTASKALVECWSISRSWAGMDFAQDYIRMIGDKLSTVLDEDGLRFQGNAVYA